VLYVTEPPKFDIAFWGIKISAQGAAGIVAAVIVVGMFIALYRF
jgi:hypothetical protein